MEHLNPVEQRSETMEINDTAGFREVLGTDLEAAEAWLQKVRDNRGLFPQYDDRWLDHRERELFKALCANQDLAGAKRVVEATVDEQSKQGRKERLAELAGTPYDSI